MEAQVQVQVLYAVLPCAVLVPVQLDAVVPLLEIELILALVQH